MLIIFLYLFFDQYQSQKIAFGSCFNYEDPESLIFFEVAKHKPDLFIWLGDAAYVTQKITSNRRSPELNSTIIQYKFNLTKYNPGYINLQKNTQIEGVWDDHDYNERDGIYSNPTKETIRQLYLDFLDVSPNDTRRSRQDGIYYSLLFEKTKIILLDVRWNRNPETQDVLGSNQWSWLENELNDTSVEMFIIGSGSQILPDDRLFIDVWYQESRNRLLKLLENKNTLLITGDVHFAEILQDPCTNLLEITSSGLSFSSHYRGRLRGLFEFFAEIFQPDTYSQYYERFADKNYAIIDIGEKSISFYNETSLLYQTNFNKTAQITCQDLLETNIVAKYFWNFLQKISKFFKMLLFRQLIVLSIFLILVLLSVFIVLLILLKLFGYQIVKIQKFNKRKNE